MQKLQLSIPEPCHENWQHMTPTDQGRFCNACAKEVIDFSMMTDTEVLNYFTALTHDKVCGRALPSQLERTISKPKDPKKRLFWYWNYIVMFFMFFGKGNSAKAQGGIKPVTEINPVKANIRGKIATVHVTKQQGSRVISGKVTDKDGNPVSFASVKIKGTNGGVSADANGAYSLKVNSNAILFISGAGFKDAEVAVGLQSNVNTVLEKGTKSGLTEVIVTGAFGGMKARLSGKNAVRTNAVNPVIILEVKEDNTSLPIDKAAITITRKGDNLSGKSFSDKKGTYEFKQIKLNDSYFVKVEAAGYESNEFTIDAKDIKDREKAWEVLLKKQKTEPVRSTATAKIGKETIIRMGAVQEFVINKEPLYVVDGTIRSDKPEINPDDIADYTVLQGAAAAALFGPEGANGAIVITTRKAKEIEMKEVVVNSDYNCTRRAMAGGMSYTNTYEDSFLDDTIATVKTFLSSSIKVYPNPVQRNTGFSVALQLKQAGNYSLQVTDASGRILLLQKFNAGSKDHTEKIMSDSRWAGGIYYIRVFDAQNKLMNKSSFIVQ